MSTHRDNVRMTMDDLAVAQAARRLRQNEQDEREIRDEVDQALWVMAYGVVAVAAVVFAGIVWWGW